MKAVFKMLFWLIKIRCPFYMVGSDCNHPYNDEWMLTCRFQNYPLLEDRLIDSK